ncbi:MAG: TetR family transcriptional regulator [Acidimicrobiia bacterium]|nr:TetR family transcriptional regulator [Acidimicrobiia bacterium]
MATANTKDNVLTAAKQALIELGYSQLSTRRIAETAGVPLSQIHYHFGSKQNLMLEVLAAENERLLDRQTDMYTTDQPLWKQWEQACDYLEDDLESGYVRVLQEMTAAGWSDPEIAKAVQGCLRGWIDLLREVASRAMQNWSAANLLEPNHLGTLVGLAFLGAEAQILLGFEETETRDALRSVGEVIRHLEGERVDEGKTA